MRYSAFHAGAPAGAPAVRGVEDAALRRGGALDRAIERALQAVLDEQRPDGHWVYELEADATIPAEYVLMVHFLGEPADPLLEAQIGRYLRRVQGAHGGWPLVHGGAFDPSASVKAYFALKMIGDAPGAPHMARARAAILLHGGAERSNVFTRMLLALYGVVPWDAVPVMPVEIALLPGWFPFHLSKVSYWTRTVVAPLLVLGALKPRARNPRAVGIDELFLAPPQQLGQAPRAAHQKRLWFSFFRVVEAQVRALEPHLPARLRRHAIAQAAAFVRARLNGEHGLGAIFPAMVNAVQMLDALGVPPSGPEALQARGAIERLLVRRAGEAYCQPCLSPVWDTALMSHALLEAGTPDAVDAACRALDWLLPLQIVDLRGDWSARRPRLAPGGWAFQYENRHYPDVDDTAVVAMALERAGRLRPQAGYGDAIARARAWIVGMQGRGGGWGAFDIDNDYPYLNNIPFADHGALLDPPTADVSARCLSLLAQLDGGAGRGWMGRPPRRTPAGRALAWLLRAQERDGSWYGRWGMNYVYGTWSVLCALGAAGLGPDAAPVARARGWLASVQNRDGGWGEDARSYEPAQAGFVGAPSTASQTAWAMLGLMAGAAAGAAPGGVAERAAGGAADGATAAAVARGAAWLIARQRADGLWDEPHHTATGFARVFYLRYHGYARYFPLWALARWRNLRAGGAGAAVFGM
ncbi:squalene--hopene cyclase [Massilia forsythiae]|uniref:Squalene--hopene cyclase n=1 Tax=Massilia forsythiae TaxID=2728020 RepID=A0A7Z2ZTS3_9BURK|nr:squalene--hopene cyclase [Massilia forsythiae]QJE01828.1 squalene--hopene cyclase [Massilia forsythiae]